MKVNPRPRSCRRVSCAKAASHNFGVECGSKAELYAALSLDQTPDSLLICNGFKRRAVHQPGADGVRIASASSSSSKKLNELKMIIRAPGNRRAAGIGIRAKLTQRQWQVGVLRR